MDDAQTPTSDPHADGGGGSVPGGAQMGTAGPALGLPLGVGAVGGVVTFLALHPYLVNTEGPLGDHPGVARLVTLASAVAAGAVLGLITARVARRSTWGVVILVVSLGALAVVAFPTTVDRHESFVEQVNERSSCLGLTFHSYPPGTSDASTTVYCVGLERPLPAG